MTQNRTLALASWALLALNCTAMAAPPTKDAAAAAGTAQRVPIHVLEPAGRAGVTEAFPVAVGLIFPDGELKSVPGGRLLDDRGQAVPFLAEATGWWNPEHSSIKWLLLRFKASTDRGYFFEPGGQPAVAEGQPLAVERDGQVVVDTGPMQVRLSGKAPLFEEVVLNGHSMLSPINRPFLLSLDDGKGTAPTILHDWTVALEESTPLHASVKASAHFHDHDGSTYVGQPTAKVDLRYEFFKGESFVRVYHTITWMVRNPQVRTRELSVNLQPNLGESGTVKVGTGDGAADVWQAAWTPAAQLVAQQDAGDHFALTVGTEKVKEGPRLGGWIGLEGADGRGVSVSLRHAWQTYPTAFEIDKKQIQVQFWPRRGPFMSFTAEDIMGPEFYHHPVWASFPWSREEKHFVHERGRRDDFPNTGEGAARTHELTISFHDRTTPRTAEQLNALTQQPIVLRQDPALAMRVPFMGFRILPYNKEKYPDIERAVDTVGRMSTGRWAAMHEYGLWRFGMVRWGVPENSDGGRSLYRWMDGAQYDQQLIPWLLYLRGGDRHWFEEGEITSRFLMDVGVNHYNSMGWPTGYVSTAGGTPFPYIHYHTTKGTKVHFLSYYYHLTGYKRAKEVMNEIIEGTIATASADPEKLPVWYRRTGGREAYNMNVFWVNAYHETFDPRLKAFAEEWKNIAVHREYSKEAGEFRPPRIYLYNGLVLQQRMWNDPEMRDVMLANLERTVLCRPQDGADRQVPNAIGAQWAYDQTQDRRYAEMGWDLARSLSDVVPDMDFTTAKPQPYLITGNAIYRHFLLPILVGASLAEEVGLAADAPLARTDTLFLLQAPPADKAAAAAAPSASPASPRGLVAVRPRRDGELVLFVRLSNAGEDPVGLSVLDSSGKELARQDLTMPPAEAIKLEGPGYGFEAPRAIMSEVRLPAAKQSDVYFLRFDRLPTTGRGACAMVIGDAQIAHYIPADKPLIVHDLGGQEYGGGRFFAKTSDDVIKVTTKNPTRSPYTIRDAQTGEVLFRSKAGDPAEQQHTIGAGRLISFTVADRYPHSERLISGVEPWYSATREAWFAPEGLPAN